MHSLRDAGRRGPRQSPRAGQRVVFTADETNAKDLNLNCLSLTWLPDKLFGYLPCLVSFSCKDNELTSITDDVGLCSNLVIFDCRKNSLEFLPGTLICYFLFRYRYKNYESFSRKENNKSEFTRYFFKFDVEVETREMPPITQFERIGL